MRHLIRRQLPIGHWHAWLGDPTVADAILDRLTQRCRRFDLEGESHGTGQAARAAANDPKSLKENSPTA